MPKVMRYLPAMILGLGCLLLLRSHAQQAQPLAHPLASVLPSVAGYETVDQQLGEEERRVAGMTNYVARAFVRDSAVAFTTLVSYYDRQTQGKTIHSPRNCLPGAGWEIVDGGTRSVAAGGTQTINRYLLRNGNASAVAYYWYQGRGRIAANEYAVKWHLLRDAALFGRTEEALVRVVVPVGKAGDALAMVAADSTAQVIVTRLIGEVDRVLPTRAGA